MCAGMKSSHASSRWTSFHHVNVKFHMLEAGLKRNVELLNPYLQKNRHWMGLQHTDIF